MKALSLHIFKSADDHLAGDRSVASGIGLADDHPADLDAITEALGDMGPGDELTLSFGQAFNLRAAHLSYVRSAYLAAFALFGYAYVLGPALAPIRAAITGTDDGSLALPILVRNGAEPIDRAMFVAAGPTDLEGSIVVVMGEYAVFLPGFVAGAANPLPVFAAMDDHPQAHVRVGHILGWPAEPLHQLDHRVIAELSEPPGAETAWRSNNVVGSLSDSVTTTEMRP